MAHSSRGLSVVGPCVLSLFAIVGSIAEPLPQDQPPPPGQDGGPPAPPPPQRPSVPQQQQQPQRPGGDQPQFRLPPGVEFVPSVVYASATSADGASHELLLNSFFPKQSGGTPLPAIIYIHGGGFTGGSREIGNQYSALLATGGYFTVTIDYRLLGDAPFPAAIHDCKAAVRFLRANAEELGIDPERIGVWGHSAGGHLAAFLGTAGNAAETHGDVGDFDEASSSVTCVVDFFGPSDFTSLRQTRRADGEIRIFGDAGRQWSDDERAKRLMEAGPLHWVDAADPPFLIIHGTEDRVVPLQQSQLLHDALSAAGVSTELIPIEGAGHGIREPGVLLRAAEFFDQHLGGSAAAAFARLQQQATDRPQEQPAPQRPAGEPSGPRGGGAPGGGDASGQG